ncbi:radical SAM protein [Dactylosporangium sp. NPDC006015]|uniref:radical SAM protein n=1 Tax=Dactylosporangium sp. NPDC006015 TaxID=3154576 RepID=UPI00339DC709
MTRLSAPVPAAPPAASAPAAHASDLGLAASDLAPSAADPGLSASDFKLDSIDLYITSRCNRRCSYCFLPDAYFDRTQHMTPAAVAAIVAWAAGAATEITVLGGEPALHPQFTSIVRDTAAAPIRVRTVTNGSRQFRAALPEVRSSLSRVAVSLDAPSAAVVDRLRGRGAFADAVATVADLRAAGVPFDLNCTVLADTVDLVPEMLAYAEDSGAGRLNMHWFSPVGRGASHAADQSVPAAAWRREVLDVVAAYRPARQSFTVDCQIAFDFPVPGADPGACAVQDRTNLQFLPSGAVFACGMLLEDEALAAYHWHDGVLMRRSGDTELSRTAPACAGCPLRPSDGDHHPTCIYNRLAV